MFHLAPKTELVGSGRTISSDIGEYFLSCFGKSLRVCPLVAFFLSTFYNPTPQLLAGTIVDKLPELINCLITAKKGFQPEVSQHFMIHGADNVINAVGLIHIHMYTVVLAIETALDAVLAVMFYVDRHIAEDLP